MEAASVSPPEGYNTGPASFNLYGNGFIAGSTVSLVKNGYTDIPAAVVTVQTSTSIFCTFDLKGSSVATWNIVVTSGSLTATLPNTFGIKAMKVTSVSPDTGYNTSSASFTLSGNGFVAGSTVSLVKNGYTAIPGTSVTVVSSTSITCTFDLKGSSNTLWNIAVTSGPFTGTLSNAFHVDPMDVASVSPDTGYNTSSASFTLYGAGFVTGSTVGLTSNGYTPIPGTDVTVWSSTRITCAFDLKGSSVTTWNVVVTSGPFTGTLSNTFKTKPMKPSSVSPDTGYNTGSASFTLYGDGFVAGSTVSLVRSGYTDIPGTGVTVLSSTSITCAFDLKGSSAGTWNITVTSGPFAGTLSNTFQIEAMRPVSVSPDIGYNTGSASFMLYGNGFVTGSTVSLTRAGYTDIPGAGVTVLSSTRITCAFDLKGSSAGLWNVVVTSGPFTGTLANTFSVQQMQPASVSPGTGYNTGSVAFALYGAGFVTGSTVSLVRNGYTDIPATAVTVVSSVQITCTFDLKGSSVGLWSVVVTSGPFTGILANTFNIQQMGAVSVSPAIGYNTGSAFFTLYGAGFVTGSTASLTRTGYTDIPGTGVTVVSSTSITCTFDLRGSSVGQWNITVTSGAFTNTSANILTIQQMQIVSVSPDTGYNTSSASFTLYGDGFVTGSTVSLVKTGYTDIPGTDVVVVSSVQITCTFDLKGSSNTSWNIMVTSGPFTGILSNAFSVDPMDVTSVSPDTGYNTAPASFTLYGNGFVTGSTVSLTRSGYTDIPGAGVTVLSSTRITCMFDLKGSSSGLWGITVTSGPNSGTISGVLNVLPMQIAYMLPASGSVSGAVNITDLSGTGFVAGSTVSLKRAGQADIPGTGVVIVSSVQITCAFDLTGKATGYWDVIVTTGLLTAVRQEGFLVNPVVSLDSVSPVYGYNTGAQSGMILRGSGFAPYITTARLTRTAEADIPAYGVNVTGAGVLQCSFDLTGKATGYWNVVVDSGAFTAALTNAFEVRPMSISSVSPAYGPNTGSTAFTILGSGFAAGSQVKLSTSGQSDITASGVSVPSQGSVTGTFDLTGKATGYWNLSVTSGALTVTLDSGFEIKPMTLLSVSPDSGYNTGQIRASLTGIGFIVGSTITLSRSGQADIPGAGVSVPASTSAAATFNLSGAATGYWDVSVTSGATRSVLAGGFIMKLLAVSSVTPGVGYNALSAVSADITGEGFAAGVTVRLSKAGQSDIPASGVVVVSSSQISCLFDLSGKTTGYWDVVISTGGTGALTATLPGGYYVSWLGVASVTPGSGYNSAVVNVDLLGGGFTSGSLVKLTKSGQADIAATGFVYVSSAQISCSFDLAGKATGYWNVSVSTGGAGALSAVLTNGFLVNPFGPSAVTPAIGYNSGPAAISELGGGGFAAGAEVKLTKTGQSDIPATGVTILSSTRISCGFDLTGKATGYWNIVVSSGGTASLSATLTNGFLVSPFGASGATPDVGYNSGTTTISELRGGGFFTGVTVTLAKAGQSDIPASGVTVLSSTRLACLVDLTDKATGYWDIVLTTGGPGSLSAVLSQGFRVYPPVSTTELINGLAASSVTLALESGNIEVRIPAGTFSGSVSLTVSTAQVSATAQKTIAMSAIGVRISNDRRAQPAGNVEITMFYRHSDIAGLDEANLSLGRYDEERSRWIPLPSVVYPDLHKVTGETNHFSVFALLELKPSSTLGLARVFPSPFTPANHPQGLTIDNLTTEAEIRIFSVSGELIRKVEYTAGTGRTVWDGKNSAGRTVASGVYIAVIKGAGETKKVKIAVEK
jgi:hypothetical protein